MTATRRLDDQVDRARLIALIAHAGQTDKLGADYIDHPRRIAESLTDPTEQAVAWLHDVLEDTPVTAAHLRAAGVAANAIDAVELLTRRPGVTPEDYYEAIRRDSIARAVKLADIADNTLSWRVDQLRALDPDVASRLTEKYAKARRALGAEEETNR